MKLQKKLNKNKDTPKIKNTNSVNQIKTNKLKLKLKPSLNKINLIKPISFLSILLINLFINQIGYGEITPVSDRTPQVRDAIVAAVPNVDVAGDINESDLAKIQELNLSSLNISSLKSGDFSGLTNLLRLNLSNNSLKELPAKIFEGLTSLQRLRLSHNLIHPFPILVSLKSVEDNHFRAEMPTGAPFKINMSVTITRGTFPRDIFNLTIPAGKLFSETITLSRTPGTTQEVSVDINGLPWLPDYHFGYYLRKSALLPLKLKIEDNTSPEFSDDLIATRSMDRNIAAGDNIGNPVSATDAENDTLTYSLGGPDAALFDVDSTNGQLKAKASTDYTVKSSYYVTLTVSDGKLTDKIVVVIVVPENIAPLFSSEEIALRSISENILAGTAIGDAVSATDENNDTLTYSLEGVDASFFDLDTTTGQLKAKASVDYKTKSVYYLRLIVSDGSLTDEIIVIIAVVENRVPVFLEGEFAIRRIPENTPPGVNIGPAVSASDMDMDILTYSLGGVDAPLFTIDSETGQIKTKLGLDFEKKQICFLKVFVSDGAVSDSINVLIALVNTDDIRYVQTIIPVSVRTPVVRDAIVAALPGVNSADEVTTSDLATISELVLRDAGITKLKRGDFSGLTGLVSLNLHGNQLTSLPIGIFEGLTSLKMLRLARNMVEPLPLVVSIQQVSEGAYQAIAPTGATFDIVLPLEVTNGIITSGETSITIPTGSMTSPIFNVISTTGSISDTYVDIGILPRIPVNHYGYVIAKSTVCSRTKQVADAINMIVQHVTDCYNITDIDLAKIPALNMSNMGIKSLTSYDFRGMLSLSRLSLKDNEIKEIPDGLFYRLISLKELDLSGNMVNPLSLTVSLERVEDSIFRVIVPACAPFDIKVPISIENGVIEDGITSITIPLGSESSRLFTAIRTTGTKNPVTVELGDMPNIPLMHKGYVLEKDSEYQLEIIPRINTAPVFTEGANTIRSVAENTQAGIAIGNAITAIDAEGGTLTYRLGGKDADVFDIDNRTGQLRTLQPLDYESKSTYSVIVFVSDIYNARTSINVTVTITDVFDNRPPVFNDGKESIRTVSEDTEAGENIGKPISATDSDGDALTYSLSGADASAFNIDSETGQLQTRAPLDYESKTTYTVIISVSDGFNANQNITVLVYVINVIEINEYNFEPVFIEGDSATRTVAENTASGVNIGEPVSATDSDSDTLTYSLGGTDAASFSIESASGQLRTSAALDFEDKSSYVVTVTVSDSHGGRDSIEVAILISNVFESPINSAPVFTEGERATRTIEENTTSGVKIGNPIFASDVDNDKLTYKLSGVNGSLFSIDSSTGQILTKVTLDYESKSTYSVVVNVSDGNGGNDTISITIYIRDVNENRAPVFVEGTATTRSVAENTGSGVNIGAPVSARDADNDILTYSLSGRNSDSFSIDSSSGQLRTETPLDYESKSTYSVTISVSDNNTGVDRIAVTIIITDIVEGVINNAPVFTDGSDTIRYVSENASGGTNIGTPVSATDADNDTLIYSVSSTDASLFDIDSRTGQLRTLSTLNYEDRNVYSVIVSVSDNSLTATINVTINVTDENDTPVFSYGGSIRIEVTDNVLSANVDIGSAVSASDEDNNSLTYRIDGNDASYFDIDESTGQISTKESVDFSTKTTYTFMVHVSDNSGGSTSITVVVALRFTNNAPMFTEGSSTTRSIPENTLAGVAIGSPVSATDLDNDTLIYSLVGTDASAFRIDSNNGQLRTLSDLDFETKSRYSVTITADDSKQGTDSITVTITIINVNETPTNNAPVFAEGIRTTRTVAENTPSNTDIGNPVIARDADNDTLRYELSGTDASSFRIEPNTGQLKTFATLNFEDKSQYVVIVTVSDNNRSDRITVTINVTNENDPPVFTDGTETTRSIREHAGPGINIGQPVAATDDDDSSLTYLLNGTDQTHFSIDSSNGQLRTKEPLNFETKSLYSVIITATDNRGGTTSIDVEIRLTNENDAPVFSESNPTTRTISENSATNINIGNPVSATDEDRHTLTYSLGGLDALTFGIDTGSGQLKTKDVLDFESKSLYSVVVFVTDNNGGNASIGVTIRVSNVNDAPIFTEGTSTTRSVPENAVANTNIGSPVAATDQDDVNLTYSLGGTDAASFDIDTGTGQLKTKSTLDFDNKPTHSVTVSVTDNRGGSDSIAVTIEVTEVIVENNAPTFTDGATTTRSVAENSPADTDVGIPVSAEDADDDTLSYSLTGTDAAAFDIDDSSGQIKTKDPLDFETKPTYSVSMSVTDNRGGTDSIDVTINLSNVNDAPVFTEDTSTTRSIAENTAANQNIGTPVGATDQDDTSLTYSLTGTDAAAFDIDDSSGQIKTKDPLDFETKPTYSVSVSVTDNRGGTDSIDVTINLSNVNDAPVFTEDTSTTRSIAENTAANQNIGTPISATDQDDTSLTYSLGGTDAAAFDIDDGTGQLKTKSPLDRENKASYSVTITVRDNRGGVDTIAVTITLSDVNEAPEFNDVGGSTTRSIAENSAPDTNIGSPVSATDPENDNLTYTLSGTDANSFDIDDSTGQLKTKDSLDFETDPSYTVVVSVTDNTNPSVSISVTINVTDVEPEAVEIGDRTQAVIDAIIAAIADPNVTRSDQITATHLESITTLDVQSKEITTLQAIDFDGLTALETLYLQDNLLTSLPAGIFDELSSLTTLDLSSEYTWTGNKIESLPVDIFNSLPTLTNLNLSNNELRTLPSTVFNVLGLLTCLDLHGNDLQSLDSIVFDSLTMLEKLDLSENELESLPSGTFNSLTMLTSLDLSENEFTSLHSDLFDALTALTYLNISDNPITSLPSDIFENLTALTTLDMSSLEFSSLPSDLFDDLSSLTSLILADNGLSGIPAAASAITTLTSINLSSNPLTLTVGMFDDLTSLTELILSDMGLTSIPSGFFDSLTQLTSVVLSDNPLTSLSGTEFNVLTSLENLDLDSNQLTAIPDGLFVGLTALKTLRLSNGDPDTFLRLNPVLEKVVDGKFKAVMKSGASYTMDILVEVTGGATVDRDYTLTIPIGGTESETLSVVRGNEEHVNAVSAYIEQVIVNPVGHSGYGHVVNREPIEVLPENVPVPMIAAVSISDKPLETQVLVNYPNPFNPETWIPFQLAKSADVSFIIYNMKGEIVRELTLGHLPTGYYKSRGRAAYWNGRNSIGEKVSAGIYFCRFNAGDFSMTRKMLIVK